MQKATEKVLIIDGNLTTANLGIHLGILSQERTLHEVLNGTMPIFQAIYTHPSEAAILPASLSIGKEADLESLKERLAAISDRYDLILIDAAAGIGKEVISALRASDRALVVCNPELTSIVAAIKVIRTARALGIPILGIILNRVRKGRREITVAKVEEMCEARVISIIPYEKRIPESIDVMTPIVLYKPNSKASHAFNALAASLVGEMYRKESLWCMLLRRLKKLLKS